MRTRYAFSRRAKRNEGYDAYASDKELDRQIEDWFDQYVPGNGKASTVGGEIVRAFTRVAYRWLNDGDYAGFDYGLETAGSACSYLYEVANYKFATYIRELLSVRPDESFSEKSYKDALTSLERAVVAYLNKHPERFDEPNYDDYMSFPEFYKGEDDDEYEKRKYYSDDDHWDDEDEEDEDW